MQEENWTDVLTIMDLSDKDGTVVDNKTPGDDCEDLNSRVTINVRGQVFVTYLSTLNRLPGTKLGSLKSSSLHNFDGESHEYFFDRNARIFPYILDAARTGVMHFPHYFCTPLVKREMEFWGIPQQWIAPCCLKKYKLYDDEKEAMEKLDVIVDRTEFSELFADADEVSDAAHTWRKIQYQIYLFLEEPSSSRVSMIWSIFYVFLLFGSIFLLVIETDQRFRVPQSGNESYIPMSTFQNGSKMDLLFRSELHPTAGIFNKVITIFFFIELMVRFIVWPSKMKFFKFFYNIIDTLSVVPLTVLMFMREVTPQLLYSSDPRSIMLVGGLFSIFRCLRVLKLIKHNRGLRVLLLALAASYKELLLLFLLIFIATVIFATLIFYAELDKEGNFENIPSGFWWSIITMTTVGYGDVVPSTNIGYVVGCICALCGMFITGLPIPIIASNFNLYYSHAKLRERMNKES